MQQLTKIELRQIYKDKRKSIDDKQFRDNAIIENLLKSEMFIDARTVYCYVSVDNEISTDAIINTALNLGKTVAVPYCVDNNGFMEFYRINSISDLKSGSFGIREPDISICDKCSEYENALCIVPALCFDKAGNRIGYGKGYYDRFLEKFTSVSIGLCYNDNVLDFIPANDYDMQVDYIITEKGIIDIHAGGRNG